MLELTGITKSYPAPDGGRLTVLDGVGLRLERGKSLAIVGPSGSGKSTLLNIIGGLDRPDAGKVLLEGQDLWSLDASALAAARNRRIGFIFQLHHLLPACTVLENVLVPTIATAGGDGRATRQEAMRLLERVGLKDRADYRPGQLSGGERQRTAVARALINRPALLLADEPTGSLDHASAQSLSALLSELKKEEGTALIVVTHSLELARQMDARLVLRDSRLHEDGPA